MAAVWRGYFGGMQLHWYAETRLRRTRQLVADIVAVLALALCLWVGHSVHDATTRLAGPGRSLESAGAGLADRLGQAATAAGGVPLAGDALRTPLDAAGGAARSIEQAGVDQQHAVTNLARTLGLVTGGVPAAFVLVLWLPRRIRFARTASAAARLRESGLGLDVFAVRALARQPISVLARLPKDPAAGWRQRDPEVIAALAELELRDLGLRRPAAFPR